MGCEIEQVEIVVVVADAHRSRRIKAETVAEPGSGAAFVDIMGVDFHPDRVMIER